VKATITIYGLGLWGLKGLKWELGRKLRLGE
jgi:hypothetical protein